MYHLHVQNLQDMQTHRNLWSMDQRGKKAEKKKKREKKNLLWEAPDVTVRAKNFENSKSFEYAQRTSETKL